MRVLLLSVESERARVLQKELIESGHRVQIAISPSDGSGHLLQQAVDTFGPHVVFSFDAAPKLELPEGVPMVSGGEEKLRSWMECP